MVGCSKFIPILLVSAVLAGCAGGGDRAGSERRTTLGLSQDIGAVFGTQSGYMNPLNLNR